MNKSFLIPNQILKKPPTGKNQALMNYNNVQKYNFLSKVSVNNFSKSNINRYKT